VVRRWIQEDLGNALYHYEEVNRDMTQAARHRLQLLADVRYSTVHALQSQGLKCSTWHMVEAPSSAVLTEWRFQELTQLHMWRSLAQSLPSA